MTEETRVTRKKAETKEKIFNTAVELFLQQGYDETTVEQIAEKADVAKGTFFNHFPTKDSILFYLGLQRLAILEDMLAQELLSVCSASEKIYTCLKIFAQMNEDNKEITALVISEVVTKQILDFDKAGIPYFKKIFKKIICQGQEDGEFRHNFNPGQAADILVSMYFFTLLDWLEGRSLNPLVEEFLARAEIILVGITEPIMGRE